MKVELSHIHKHFGAVHANNDITLTVPAGTIQGILGENGAGKSTLMKVLSGFIQADEGEIRLDDQPVYIANPADAIVHGIGMLHQDPLDFPPMRVIDDFLIGRSDGKIFPDRDQASADLKELSQQFDFDIDPETYVDSLTVGERQQLEILRLLWLGARVLILDEPTTGISALQKEKLFATLKKLVAQGMTVIFVSHKLEEVEGLCGQVAVLQRGRLVGETRPPYTTDNLVQMMFGKVIQPDQRVNACQPDTQLLVKNLEIDDFRLNIKNVNLQIHLGEVIGLAGMEGSGQSQFLRTLGGLMRPVGGELILGSRNLAGKPYKQFMESRIAFMPAARLEEGLIPGLTLTDHFVLCGAQQGFFINKLHSHKITTSYIQDFSIRGTPDSTIEALSGGNQQRALLALLRQPLNLLLMEHPTRGLDIESTIWIWGKLKERCRQGTSIVFISADLDEVIRYSDRILVFFGGRVSQPVDAASTSAEQLGQMIGGKGW